LSWRRIVCLLVGHSPAKYAETWKQWKGGYARKKFRKRRRSWWACQFCGKPLEPPEEVR